MLKTVLLDFRLYEDEDRGLLQDLNEYGTLFPSYVYKALTSILKGGRTGKICL